MLYKNGEKYKGKMIIKIIEGYGKMLYKNGDKYEGYFKNDKKNGEGKII